MNRYSAFMDWKIQHSKERQKKSGNKNGKKSKGKKIENSNRYGIY